MYKFKLMIQAAFKDLSSMKQHFTHLFKSLMQVKWTEEPKPGDKPLETVGWILTKGESVEKPVANMFASPWSAFYD